MLLPKLCRVTYKTSVTSRTSATNANSGYSRNAKVCYAYLSDVPADELQTDLAKPNSHFSRSKWFTRGWTLVGKSLTVPYCH